MAAAGETRSSRGEEGPGRREPLQHQLQHHELQRARRHTLRQLLLQHPRGGARRQRLRRLAAAAAVAASLALLSRGRASAPPRAWSFAGVDGADPESLFNALFLLLAATAAGLKLSSRCGGGGGAADAEGAQAMPPKMSSLRWRFLGVFWMFKMADWLQGPYFYDVYASKRVGGETVSADFIARLFLTGFLTSGLLSAQTGRFVDSYGRKAGSLAFAAFYALSAVSTYSSSVPLLFLGRVAGGVGTALLFSAPEAWFVGEHQREGHDGRWLGETFGLAYLGDSIVAIGAGQIASAAASRAGPAAPFGTSLAFLALGAALAAGTWGENAAPKGDGGASASVGDAWRKMLADPRILSVGAVQALFEGAMYIFVMQWPPALISALAGRGVPFGKVFSCLMASCMIGSSVFGPLTRARPVEQVTAAMLGLAASAIGLAAATAGTEGSLAPVLLSFFVFEACVGFYFPAIGTLRSKYLPDSHRGLMMASFRVPLNIIVVSVMLSMNALGLRGSLGCSAAALLTAFLAQLRLCGGQ